ncbi:MAG: thioredoxin-disulfide reductase [Clostridia bacterium]
MIDIAIVGGGPAGLSAGIYGARSGRSTVLFEGVFLGGQITRTASVENYPGFYESIDGFSIADKFEKQAVRFGLEIKSENVTALQLSGITKKIICGSNTYEAKTVIIATGAMPRKLGISREGELTGAGISYCATCDGAFFREKAVAVVGGGDTAVSDALYLAKFASRVYLVHRRNQLRAVQTLQDALRGEKRIELVLDNVPNEICGESAVSALKVRNVKTDAVRKLEVEGIFVAIGIDPNSSVVKDELKLDNGGYIITDTKLNTSVTGVFAAGDVRDTPLRQVVTAAADGAVAATSAIEYLMA